MAILLSLSVSTLRQAQGPELCSHRGRSSPSGRRAGRRSRDGGHRGGSARSSSLLRRRGVHAGFAAEVQDVLQREDAEIGDGAGGGADHRPDDVAVVVDGLEVGLHVGALVRGCVVAPPAQRGVVVVGAGVDDGVGDEAVRQIEVAPRSEKPNCRMRMPGMPKCSRSSSTSCVMRPRSSAMKGSSPKTSLRRWKSSGRGP